MKIKTLIGKFKRTWKEVGLKGTLEKTVQFFKHLETNGQRELEADNARKNRADILFIKGCMDQHPIRYRVEHQIEQLEMAGISTQVVFFTDLEMRMEENYKAFYFFRCECTAEVEQFINQAKLHGKRVYFDIDDLITDKKYVEALPFVQELTPSLKEYFYGRCMRTGLTLAKCDIAITTTEGLEAELRKVAPKAYINRNVASKEMVACAEQAYRKNQNSHLKTDRIWLGYFSGSLTHNADFELIRSALMKLMENYSQVGLLLVGELEESDELKQFGDRIIKMKATDWRNLPNLIVQADINLAPLEDTLFNRAKSEIKWIEAALVRVPTVASCVGPYETMIENMETGILCKNTTEAWYEGLRVLIEDERKRTFIAEKAYNYVMKYCTTEAKACEFAEFIKETME